MFLIISGRYLNLGDFKVLNKIPKGWQKNELEEWEHGKSIAKRLIFNLECENKDNQIKFDFINYSRSVIIDKTIIHFWKCNGENSSIVFENPEKYGIKIKIEEIECYSEDNSSRLEKCTLIYEENKLKENEYLIYKKSKQIALDLEYINKTGKVNLSKTGNSYVWDKSTNIRPDNISDTAFRLVGIDFEKIPIARDMIMKYETTAERNEKVYAKKNRSIIYYQRGRDGVCKSGTIVIYDGFKNVVAKRTGFKFNRFFDKQEFCDNINKKMFELAEKYSVNTENFGLSIVGDNFVNKCY